MILPVSNLKFIEFFILRSNFQFNLPENEIDIRELFDKYFIDVDFGKREEKMKDKIILEIFVKANINNQENPLPGYSLSAEGVGIFELSFSENLAKQDLDSLKDVSSLSITINALRNYITQITMSGPVGKFNLPAVSVNDLIKQKLATQEN